MTAPKMRCQDCKRDLFRSAFELTTSRTCNGCKARRRDSSRAGRDVVLAASGGMNTVIVPAKSAAGLCEVKGCERRGVGRLMRVRVQGGKQADIELCSFHGSHYVDVWWASQAAASAAARAKRGAA